MVLQESGGDPTIINPNSGAVGLMQVMPRDGKAATNSCHCFWDRPSIAQLQVDTFNLDFALKFLRQKVDQESGSIRDGLFRYGTAGVGYAYADIILGLGNKIGGANK